MILYNSPYEILAITRSVMALVSRLQKHQGAVLLPESQADTRPGRASLQKSVTWREKV
jgi:hypothetical protein